MADDPTAPAGLPEPDDASPTQSRSPEAVALTRVLGDLGHEIGTPLGSITMMVEMLADGSPATVPAHLRTLARNLGSAAQEVRTAVRGLIRAQRLWSGLVPIELETVPRRALLARLAEHVDWDPPVDAEGADWHTDPERVVELAATLGRFVGSRGPRPRISLGDRDGRLRIRARVDAELPLDEPGLLDPFGAGELKLARRHGGPGVELAIVALLARLLGGRCALSQAEGGTSIRVEVPTGHPAGIEHPA